MFTFKVTFKIQSFLVHIKKKSNELVSCFTKMHTEMNDKNRKP